MENGFYLVGKCVGVASRKTKNDKVYQEISVLVTRNDGASDLHKVRDYGSKVKVDLDKPIQIPVFLSSYVKGTTAFLTMIALGGSPAGKGAQYAV